MTRTNLIRQINQLQDEVLLLASMVEQNILEVVQALSNRDIHSAKEIYERDQDVNEKRFAIENAVLIVIATQQPAAHDLRQLTAMLVVIHELERMGDYAKGIAKVIVRLGDSTIDFPIRDLIQMAEQGVSMLHRALTSFIEENPNEASQIPIEDNIVDDLYNKVYYALINGMIADPKTIDQRSLILWVVHDLERFADRVTNICERTVFIATGDLLEFDTSDDEDLMAND